MKNTFLQFIIDNFTVTVFVSIIVFKIFGSLIDDIITPVILGIIDPNKSLDNFSFNIGNYKLELGNSIKVVFVCIIILFIVYRVTSSIK